MVRSLLFDPELHTGSLLEKILLDIILPLGDNINKLHTPRYAFFWSVITPSPLIYGMKMESQVKERKRDWTQNV
jgi:hypothetical protein